MSTRWKCAGRRAVETKPYSVFGAWLMARLERLPRLRAVRRPVLEDAGVRQALGLDGKQERVR